MRHWDEKGQDMGHFEARVHSGQLGLSPTLHLWAREGCGALGILSLRVEAGVVLTSSHQSLLWAAPGGL